MNRTRRWAALVAVALSLLCACARGESQTNFVGRWDSTTSDAWIEIHQDMTFEARDYPIGLKVGDDCRHENVARQDLFGNVDASTLSSGFLYVNGGDAQWWVDRSLTGAVTLRVDICVESLHESYERHQ